MPERILVAGLFHEGNSFSTLLTRRESFAITFGDAVLDKAKTSMSALGGACRRLTAENVEIVPVLTAFAPPGGPVEDAVFDEFQSILVQAVESERFDGIYLDLHGAMITESSDDPEGDLLSALRARVGIGRPIAVSLDLHAHVTQAMLERADIAIACKENPHTDYHLAGEKAAALLLETIRGTFTPKMAAVWLPFVIGAKMETATGPLHQLHAAARDLCMQNPRLADISIYNTTSLVDASGAGQCITALSDDDAEACSSAVEYLGGMLWSLREDFTSNLPELDSVLAEVRSGTLQRPVVIGDQGDRVLAGTPGDGTHVLHTLVRSWSDLRCLVPVTDPDAVGLASRAGLGAAIRTGIGGRYTSGQQPLELEWSVVALGNGKFIQRGPYLADEPATLGRTALLRSGNVTVLATALPGFTQDPAAFESQGARLAEYDVIVSKSGYHFKLSFENIGTCVVVNTPGISNYRPGSIPYRKRQLPIGNVNFEAFRWPR